MSNTQSSTNCAHSEISVFCLHEISAHKSIKTSLSNTPMLVSYFCL